MLSCPNDVDIDRILLVSNGTDSNLDDFELIPLRIWFSPVVVSLMRA